MRAPDYIYNIYDRVFSMINFPCYYCSQCEKKVRYWIYHFNGLVYCQECADGYVARLEESSGRRA